MQIPNVFTSPEEETELTLGEASIEVENDIREGIEERVNDMRDVGLHWAWLRPRYWRGLR